MNKFNKTVLALALTASLGFGGQAFANDMSASGTAGSGGMTTNGTSTTDTTTGAYGNGMMTGDHGMSGTGTTGTSGGMTGTYGGTTGTTGTAGSTTGTYNGTGTAIGNGMSNMGSSVRNYSDNMLDRMSTYNNTNDTTGYGYGGNYDTSTYRTTAADDNGTDWGWLGLLGLLGLAGMRSNNKNRDKEFTSNNR